MVAPFHGFSLYAGYYRANRMRQTTEALRLRTARERMPGKCAV